MKVLLIVYDNDSFISDFPLNIAYIASALRGAGHEVSIYNQDVYHYPEAHLAEYLKKNRFDVVGVGVIAGYYQYRKLLKISEAINSVPNRPFYMIGGHGPSPEPEYFMKKTGADVVVIGEGEVTVVELLDALANKKPFSKVDGIAYLENNKLVKTKTRELIKEVDSIALPAWDLFNVTLSDETTNIKKTTTDNKPIFPIIEIIVESATNVSRLLLKNFVDISTAVFVPLPKSFEIK